MASNTTKNSPSKAKNAMYSSLWNRHRQNESINFSDVIEEQTFYESNQTSKSTFEPNEITGRSTSKAWQRKLPEEEIDVDAVSVNDILGNSFVENIRHMSQSKHGAKQSLAISLPKKYPSTNSLNGKEFSWNNSFAAYKSNNTTTESMKNEQFQPFDDKVFVKMLFA